MMGHIYDTKNKMVNFMLDTIAILIFLLIIIALFNGMYNIISTAIHPNPPEDLSILANSYLGLPFIFWIMIAFGLMFGLTFHGFNLVNISISNNTVKEKDKK